MSTLTFTASTAPNLARSDDTTADGQSLLQRIRVAMLVRRQRRALLALDDRMLADVGLSRADVYREVHRPFLDMPVSSGRSAGR